MRAGAELQPPVGYDDRWLLLAVLALAVVAAYYVAVLWWTRGGFEARFARASTTDARTSTIAHLDAIEAAVATGRITARQGHQQVSEVVRGFVADTAGVPARTMTLADLQHEGPERLAAVVALVYPPAFGPGDDLSHDRLPANLSRARELVASWE